MTLALDAMQLAIVRGILASNLPAGTKIWVFGSRAAGRPKPFSDLDLALDAGRPLTLHETANLRDAFSESDLPWKVDVVDRQTITPEFWAAIEPGAVLL